MTCIYTSFGENNEISWIAIPKNVKPGPICILDLRVGIWLAGKQNQYFLIKK